MPHFFVDDAFADSKEVMSIPSRYRNAAIGLWTRCGAWSAGKLTDGVVPMSVVESFAGKSAPRLVELLVAATLWESDGDLVRFRNWSKWQRTRKQVESFRAFNAQKQRRHRDRLKHGKTSENTKSSPGYEPGDDENRNPLRNPTPVPIPIPKYLTGSLSSSSQVSKAPPAPPPDTAIEPIAATDGGTLVRSVIPSEHPAATQTALRLRANELLHAGTPESDVREALTLWLTKPHLGPNALSALVSEVIKSRDQPKPSSKLRAAAELAQRMRDEENQAQRKELA